MDDTTPAAHDAELARTYLEPCIDALDVRDLWRTANAPHTQQGDRQPPRPRRK